MKKQYIEKATKLDLQKEKWNGLEEGEKKGISKEKNEIAKKMKEEGLDVEIIVKVTGLTKEEIEKL